MKDYIKVEELKMYLGTNLQVQYKGIINGIELSKYREEYNKRNLYSCDFPFSTEELEPFNSPKEIIGNRVGYIKIIEDWKNGTSVRVGTMKAGLKRFTLFGGGFKPIVKPLSKLTEEDKKGMTKDDIIAAKLGFTSNISLSAAMILASKHYDIFNWLGRGLAIEKED